MNCKSCGSNKITEEVTMKDNVKMIDVICEDCGSVCFTKQWQDNSALIMPFGKKHKGKTISAIVKEDRSYAEWAAENMHNNIGRRFVEELGLKGSGEPVESMSADGKKAYGPGNPGDAPF